MDAQHLDAKLEAVEARTDTKFAELIGEMRLISSNLTHLSIEVGEVKAATASIKANILTATLTICGLIVGLVALGFQIFSTAQALFASGFSAQ